jgi:hypothetical protein
MLETSRAMRIDREFHKYSYLFFCLKLPDMKLHYSNNLKISLSFFELFPINSQSPPFVKSITPPNTSSQNHLTIQPQQPENSSAFVAA